MIIKEVSWKIGKLFPKCVNVIFPKRGDKNCRMFKIFLEIEVGKSLVRGTKIKLENETILVTFRYEHLPTFCFYCGKIGHQERICEVKVKNSSENRICVGQYGELLKVQTNIRG